MNVIGNYVHSFLFLLNPNEIFTKSLYLYVNFLSFILYIRMLIIFIKVVIKHLIYGLCVLFRIVHVALASETGMLHDTSNGRWLLKALFMICKY